MSLSLGQEGPQPEEVSFSPARPGNWAGRVSPLPKTPSGPTTTAAATEDLTSGDQGGKSGAPLPDESQATGAGAAPKEAAASKTEQVDDSEDEYTSGIYRRSACTSRNPADYGGPHVVSEPVSSDAATGQALTVG